MDLIACPDLNGNGIVGTGDLLLFLSAFGLSCSLWERTTCQCFDSSVSGSQFQWSLRTIFYFLKYASFGRCPRSCLHVGGVELELGCLLHSPGNSSRSAARASFKDVRSCQARLWWGKSIHLAGWSSEKPADWKIYLIEFGSSWWFAKC